jgi:PAS domain S-box-containing protein
MNDEVIYRSDVICDIYGLPPEEFPQSFRETSKFIHPDDLEKVRETFAASSAAGRSYDLEYRIVRSDGEVRHVHELSHPEYDEDGTLFRSVGTFQDITERKRVEEELAALNENLEKRVEERTAELRTAQTNLLRQERLATLGQLTATVSHELRNPLGVIRTSNFIVRDGLNGESPRVKRALERIDRSVIRCDRIIDELLDFTRIRDLEPVATAIDVWLGDLLDEQLLPKGVGLCREFGAPEAILTVDRDRFCRAVINVFENACQAITGKGDERTDLGKGVLTIKTRQSQRRVEVIFEDNGPGIAPDVLPRIFEPLYSTKGFGVGLGLPVVKQIMEQHGGGIEIETEEGRGTRVCLWLPNSPSTY